MVRVWLDTATDFLIVALTDDAKLIDAQIVAAKQKHSDTALYALQELLKKHQCTGADLEAVYVGAGPGSYSGIRISRMIAKTVELVRNIPIYQFSTLELIQSITNNHSLVLKAGRDQVFARMGGVDILMQTKDSFQLFDATFDQSQMDGLTFDVLQMLTLYSGEIPPNYLKAAL